MSVKGEDQRVRHAGVLGLAAYATAFPYSVPDRLPGVLVQLAQHSNCPEPISVSIVYTWKA